jgi:hypothetical protein
MKGVLDERGDIKLRQMTRTGCCERTFAEVLSYEQGVWVNCDGLSGIHVDADPALVNVCLSNRPARCIPDRASPSSSVA